MSRRAVVPLDMRATLFPRNIVRAAQVTHAGIPSF